jgi:pimeloyl-ACP methyl ester carboxylesterase
MNGIRYAFFILSLVLLASCTGTPRITDGKGEPAAGSIATLERVDLNGRKEWITLRGRDDSAPLLLFLSGGPGGSELATLRRRLGSLEARFLVVGWDQPGAGKSYGSVRHEDLEVETYVDDACALIEYLCRRFERERVVLVGESWGSYLGILVAARIPQRLSCFFGTGQMVSFTENDRECYRLALEWARERGEEAKVRKLENQGPPPYASPGAVRKLAAFLPDTFAYMREVKGVGTTGGALGDLMGQEYGTLDRINWFRGLYDSLEQFYPKLWGRDLRKEAPKLSVPVCFLIGRHDVNASIPLLLDYFARLDAPGKEIVWFEESGHTPWASESDRFVEELAARALKDMSL